MTLYDPDDDLDTLRTKGLLLGMMARNTFGGYFALLSSSDSRSYYFAVDAAKDAGFDPVLSGNNEAALLREAMDLYEKGCPVWRGNNPHFPANQAYVFGSHRSRY